MESADASRGKKPTATAASAVSKNLDDFFMFLPFALTLNLL
jgi:hypothetical protein